MEGLLFSRVTLIWNLNSNYHSHNKSFCTKCCDVIWLSQESRPSPCMILTCDLACWCKFPCLWSPWLTGMLRGLISKRWLCIEITCCKMLCQVFLFNFFFKSTYRNKTVWYDTSKPTKTFFKIYCFPGMCLSGFCRSNSLVKVLVLLYDHLTDVWLSKESAVYCILIFVSD